MDDELTELHLAHEAEKEAKRTYNNARARTNNALRAARRRGRHTIADIAQAIDVSQGTVMNRTKEAKN